MFGVGLACTAQMLTGHPNPMTPLQTCRAGAVASFSGCRATLFLVAGGRGAAARCLSEFLVAKSPQRRATDTVVTGSFRLIRWHMTGAAFAGLEPKFNRKVLA